MFHVGEWYQSSLMTKMRWFFQVLTVVLSLSFGVVLPMKGGGDYKPSDFAFTVLVKTGSPKKTVCIGVLDSESTFITSSKCLTRVNPEEKNLNQFVASVLDPAKDIPIEKVEPGKFGDAPEEGMSLFPDYATVIARAKPPGLEVKAKDDLGRLAGTGPTYTPWPEDESGFSGNITAIGATGIVPGMGNKAATMKALSDEECDSKISEMPGDMNAFISTHLELNLTERDYFCADKGADGGRFPSGYPCPEDLGAPFIVGDVVWGVLIGAWCISDTNHTALFRTAVRSWSYRRFDGSLTDPPPTTRAPDMPTTKYDGDETSTKKGGAAQKYLLEPSYILAIVAALNIEKLLCIF